MYSQLNQDLWILKKTKFKENGYFIDIGAYDGIFHSNTYLLEQKYNWNGICIEPSKKYIELKNNRNCITENLCIYDISNVYVNFSEIEYNMELSGINEDFKDDHYRVAVNTKLINTISLTDLCVKHQCPQIIDYLSIDTEGSELKILQTHNFDKYKFSYISIEHNRNKKYQTDIQEFLEFVGYSLDTSEEFLQLQQDHTRNFEDWYELKRI